MALWLNRTREIENRAWTGSGIALILTGETKFNPNLSKKGSAVLQMDRVGHDVQYDINSSTNQSTFHNCAS
jgi:hypothetical protein